MGMCTVCVGRCMKKRTWVMWCVYDGKYFLEGDIDNSPVAIPVHVRYPCKLVR